MTTTELVWFVSLSVVILQNSLFIAIARGRAEAQERRIRALEKVLGGMK